MKLQEGGCGVADTSRDFARARSLGDAEQQANHQIPPEQPCELLGKFGGTAIEQSGCLGACHDLRNAARLISRPIESSARATSLVKPLLEERVSTDQLRRVQHKRHWPVRIIQAFQKLIQKRVIARALDQQQGLRIRDSCAFARTPFLRDLPPRLIALGVVGVRVQK